MIEALTKVPRIALALLAALALALGCPELGKAAELGGAEVTDAPLTGGAQAPVEGADGGGAAALRQVDVPAPTPDEAEAPGKEANADSSPKLKAPEPAPVPPAEEPAPLDDGRESPPDRTDRAPAPVNLNVDIRIFSPGDDGDVIQIGGPTAGSPDGSGGIGPEIDFDWDWDWTWTCGSGGVPAAKGAGSGMSWNWSWNWDCGEQPGSIVGGPVQDASPPTSAPDVGAPRPPTFPPLPLQRPPSEDSSAAGDDRGRGGGARAHTALQRAAKSTLIAVAPSALKFDPAPMAAERRARPAKTGNARDAEPTEAPS